VVRTLSGYAISEQIFKALKLMTAKLNIYQSGQGRKLILLHGWGMNAAIFRPLLDYLNADYEVFSVDLPGHGHSDMVDVDFDRQVEILAQQLPDGMLLGWSMGGLYATALAKRYPARFSHLLLVSSNPCFVQQPDWPSAVPKQVFDEFSASLKGDWISTIKRFIGLQLHGAEQARQLIRHVTELLMEGGAPQPLALSRGLALLLNFDAREMLAQLHQPVMMVLGRRDTLVPVSLEQQINRVYPSIRVECFAHSAHIPFVSHPQQFADLLREFTQSTPSGQSSS
jgi:pimeloyl-[acyl-carrier protein] methyl ester esterase